MSCFLTVRLSDTVPRYLNGKCTGSYIALFYSNQAIKVLLNNLPQSAEHFFLYFSNVSALYLTFTHIHAQMDASQSNLGSVSCSRIFSMQTEAGGIEPPTFQLVSDLLHFLSYSHSCRRPITLGVFFVLYMSSFLIFLRTHCTPCSCQRLKQTLSKKNLYKVWTCGDLLLQTTFKIRSLALSI